MNNKPAGRLTNWAETQQLKNIAKKTDNMYRSIVIIAARSKQIATKLKEELSSKLEEFSSSIDTLDEVFENQEQIEISKYYEKLPHPTLMAKEEFMNDDTYYRFRTSEEIEEEETAEE